MSNTIPSQMSAPLPATMAASAVFSLDRETDKSHVGIRFILVTLSGLFMILHLALFVAPVHAHEVVILKSANITAYNQVVSGFKSTMPPDTTFIEYDLKGDTHAGRVYAAKIRASAAHLVLAVGSKAAIAARLEIFDIPVVYSMVLHPQKYDLKAPNLVGVPTKPPIGQQLDMLRTLMPKLTRIGYLFDPDKTSPLQNDVANHARQLGFTFIARQVHSAEQVPAALRELLPKVEALWLISDSTVLTEESFSFLLHEAFDQHIPVIGFDPEFTRRGALISFWIDSSDIGRQAAHVAQNLLAGTGNSRPKSPMPKQRMALNLGTAEYLGITIPPSIHSIADAAY